MEDKGRGGGDQSKKRWWREERRGTVALLFHLFMSCTRETRLRTTVLKVVELCKAKKKANVFLPLDDQTVIKNDKFYPDVNAAKTHQLSDYS